MRSSGSAKAASSGVRVLVVVQDQPAAVVLVAHAPDVTGPLQAVDQGRRRARGQAQVLAQLAERERGAGPVGLRDGQQRTPVGRVQAVPLGEGPPEPHRRGGVTAQQPGQLGAHRGVTGRGVHERRVYRRPTSLHAEGNSPARRVRSGP